MDFEQIISLVKTGITGRTLMECAERSQTRIGIRGGVTRNLLLGKIDEFHDLLDAIDPFSDVDLVVDDHREGIRALKLIFASVPFASFFRWELMTKEDVTDWLKQHLHFASDESVIWIDGRSGRAAVTLSKLGASAGLTFDQPLKEHDLRERFGMTPPLDLLLTYLKLLTILSRRPERPEESAFVAPFQRLMAERREQLTNLNVVSAQRVDLQLAKLFGASVELGRETAQLAVLSDLFDRQLFPSHLLTLMSGLGKKADTALGMWRSSRIPRFKLALSALGADQLGLSKLNIPNFTLNSTASECCPYADFSEGPATVMWRGPSLPQKPLERLTLSATAEVQDTEGFYDSSIGYGVSDPERIQIPNRISRRNGLIARMDHGFLGAVLGRPVRMQVSVQEVAEDA
ncbi:MAG: hypothetical protein WCE63_13150 [Acidobacteriaceae bacterium]